MAKVYSVEGQSSIKPTGLPKGLTVKEEERPKGGTATSLYGTVFTVTDYSTFCDGNTVSLDIKSKPNYRGVTEIDTNKLFSFEEARNLRDALNDVLGESTSGLRTVTDRDGDNWFEVSPDNFVIGADRVEAEERWITGGRLPDYGCAFYMVEESCGIKNVTVG